MKTKILLTYICLFIFSILSAGDPLSSFTKTTKDRVIDTKAPTAVITKTFRLTKTQNVLVVADGTFSPYTKNGKAQMIIQIDKNTSASNSSIIDWGTTKNPQPHTYNCIASARLSKGTHTIRLIASVHSETPNTNFVVNLGSGLSILIDAAPNIISSIPDNPNKIINIDTGKKGGVSPLTMENVMTNHIDVGKNPTNVVTLSSGTSYKNCGEGDALWGIFLNKEDCINNGTSQWSVNDILGGAEKTAPMFLHSLHSLSGKNDITLKASELSFKGFENDVCYEIEKSTRLISLYGMKFSGKATITNTYCNREEWGFFGSSMDKKNYPSVGTSHAAIITDVDIPPGHNGIVLFLAKFRLQPDQYDEGGKATLWMNIDGVDVGTIGIQGFKKPDGASSRTITASYLSSENKLSVGKHRLLVYLKAEGEFMRLAHSLDLPLVYFD